jgi:hypothetical protein
MLAADAFSLRQIHLFKGGPFSDSVAGEQLIKANITGCSGDKRFERRPLRSYK